MTLFKKVLFTIGLIFLLNLLVKGTVVLPAVFSDNMVLQQKTNAAIWGAADVNATVKLTTSWDNKTYTTKTNISGKWSVKVSTPSFGGPYSITIAQGNTIELKNVLIGEVWLCSGQSNMEMPLAGWGKINNYQEEISKANYPKIRLLQAIHVTANQPKTELEVRNNSWETCTPETVAEFSSVAYFFAREIFNKTGIPVGLIHSSWGGTIAEAWTSYETLKTLPDFAAAAEKIKSTPPLQMDDYDIQVQQWKEGVEKMDKGYENKKPVWAAPDFNERGWKTMTLPGLWEEKGIPDFDGVVWFRKKIIIPDSWDSDDLTLSLSTIDDEDICFFNGEQVGTTKGYNVDRVYTIPARLVKKGANYIAVRVFDTGGGGGLYGDSKLMTIKNKNGEFIELAGDWNYSVSFSLKDVKVAPQNPNTPNRSTVLYNAMINPIINYAIRGVIWYQGESNAGRAYQYHTLFSAMIKDWRTKFSNKDMPFYFVQLASFMQRNEEPTTSDWAALREAQLKTTALPNTGMAVAIDIGNATDIHPKNKQEVGRRLALIALNKVYQTGGEFSGPLYKSSKTEGDKIRIDFDHAMGLKSSDGPIKGFSIAGADQKFYWADAVIQGTTVIVSSSKVKTPVAVRYGWSNNPEVTLVNSAGLPASPFRTDHWQTVTFGKK